jgi:mRNA interferase RelE/StbE
MHRVLLRNKARKNLAKIPRPFRQRIIAALVRLRNDPYLGEPLLGEWKGKYSLHIHPYRAIYEIYENISVIYIIRIDHRGRVYR